VVKHSYLVRQAADIPRVMKEAFYIATPPAGPVLVDLPKDLAAGPCDAPFVDSVDLPGYHVPSGRAARSGAGCAASWQEPSAVLYVGHGAVMSDAAGPSSSLPRSCRRRWSHLARQGRGAEDQPLHLGMLGMHGTAYANKAWQTAISSWPLVHAGTIASPASCQNSAGTRSRFTWTWTGPNSARSDA